MAWMWRQSGRYAAKALGLHLAGYTYVEIAAELGCTPDEAYDLVRQALKAMKR